MRSAFTIFVIMMVKILLLVSILLQLVATVGAVRLVSKTKINSVWILFSLALLLMTASRVLQFIHFVPRGGGSPWLVAQIWIDIAISLSISTVVFNARRLVEYFDRTIFQRTLTGKRILSATLRTEEKERSRFSKELHDGLGPLLSSARMSLSALPEEGLGGDQREIVQGVRHVVDEAIRSLREISNNLSPHVLGEFGLGKGVGNFVGRLAGLHDMRIDYRTNLTDERFDADVEVILYRVVCELVNNSLKHSGAADATIELTYNGEAILLTYSDNGCGFNPSSVEGTGMGLSNIASRIGTLNGELDLRGARGEGMSARIRVGLRG